MISNDPFVKSFDKLFPGSDKSKVTAVVDNEHLKQIDNKSSVSIESSPKDHHYFDSITGLRIN